MTTKSFVIIAGLFAASAATVTWAAKEIDSTPAHSGIVPVESVIAMVRTTLPGTIVEIELEGKKGAPRYEIEVVDATGKAHKLAYDAASGQPLSAKRQQ